MKTLNLLLLLATLLLSSGSASGAQSSSLEGTWYVGGDRGQVARITNNRGRLEARNENGDTSRLEYNGRSRVRALDWGGMTGEIRGNRIDWSNNTYWSKVQSSVTRYSNLEGAWYVGGDRSQVTSITNNRGRWEARNERGETSRLEYDGRSRVRALDWGGITGEIRGNRIDWSNNTYWSRSQSPVTSYSNLEGTWYVGGDRDKVARITNDRGRLAARNESGDTSRLEYDGRSRMRALDWGGITGEIRSDQIAWSNNTNWTRRPHR